MGNDGMDVLKNFPRPGPGTGGAKPETATNGGNQNRGSAGRVFCVDYLFAAGSKGKGFFSPVCEAGFFVCGG